MSYNEIHTVTHLFLQMKLSMNSLRFLLFIASILLFESGCIDGTNDNLDNLSSLNQQITISYRNMVKRWERDGNDEQGPDFEHADDLCESIFKDEPSPLIKKKKIAACDRMMTAQYFNGSNLSYTIKGTVIYFSDSNGIKGDSARELTDVISANGRYRKFEAIWGEHGALCISNPRWRELYQKNKPSSFNIRDCAVDPKNPNMPWIQQPFVGDGLLISYYYNETNALVTAKISNQIITASETFLNSAKLPYDSISEFQLFSPEQRPLRFLRLVQDTCPGTSICPAAVGGYSDLEEETEVAMISIWQCCIGTSCNTIVTSADLSNSERKKERGMTTQHLCSAIIQNAGYIHTTQRPGTEPLSTFEERSTSNVTTIRDSDLQKLSDRRFDKRYTEGYVYPVEIGHVSVSPVSRLCCPKYCHQKRPESCRYYYCCRGAEPCKDFGVF